MSTLSAAETQTSRKLTFGQAVREALAEEMRRDPTVFIMGEDVAEAGTPFKVLSGLVEEFGTERVMDTPISEAGFTGMGLSSLLIVFALAGDALQVRAWLGVGGFQLAVVGGAAVPREGPGT